MAEELISPFSEHKGKGRMIFDSEAFDADFTIRQMQNGRIVGGFETSSENFWKMHGLFRPVELFRLEGADDADVKLVAEGCYLTSLSGGTDPKASAKFVAQVVTSNPQKFGDAPHDELVAVFSLLNVDETFRVIVDSRIGKLYLCPMEKNKELLSSIKTLNISGITATAEIHVEKTKVFPTFREVLSDSVDVIEGFLCISRLADTCFHDWCSVSIYEKSKELDRFELVVHKMREPKTKNPRYRGLINPAHSSYFYASAYAGYKGREKELDDLYGFRIALEWYLEANIATVVESEYLMACTCLELLVDRFETKFGTEFVMNTETFDKELSPCLHKASRGCMSTLELTADQRSEVYMKLGGLNRHSLAKGIKSLLDHLKIKYDDLFGDIGEIVRVRNEITHSGTYHEFQELANAFNRLYVLLTRVFLSLVNCDHDYFDWVKGDWVHFKDLRAPPEAG